MTSLEESYFISFSYFHDTTKLSKGKIVEMLERNDYELFRDLHNNVNINRNFLNYL